MKTCSQSMVMIIILYLPIFVVKEVPDITWAQATLNRMNLQEKIGQLFVVAAASCFEESDEALATAIAKSSYAVHPKYIEKLIKEYYVGGLLFLYKSSPDKQIELANRYYKLCKYPMWIFQDCEWGLSMRLYETVCFPKNMTLGAIKDNQLLYKLGYEIGCQCKALGVDMNLAPVVDVNNNIENPVISDRSFGDDKEKVAEKALCYMRGLGAAHVLSCAKHFPGQGDTNVDSHLELPVIKHDKKHLHDIELYPFKKMIAAQCDAIMNAHLHVPAYDSRENIASSLSKSIVTDLLQKELGFEGLIVTDGLGMKAVSAYYESGSVELEAFMAGNDILLASADVPAAFKKIEQAIHDGRISLKELDRRVLKILRAKERIGVHQRRQIDCSEISSKLHARSAYALKKRLFQEAITVVPGKNIDFLPVPSSANVGLVQIGGTSESVFTKIFCTDHPCLLVHISSQASFNTCQEVIQQLANVDTVIIGIFDINKYASKQFGISNNTLQLLSNLKKDGKKIIPTIFGNAYSLKYFSQEDIVVMAYEDDQDAQEAAAQVLLGKLEAKGELPIRLCQQ